MTVKSHDLVRANLKTGCDGSETWAWIRSADRLKSLEWTTTQVSQRNRPLMLQAHLLVPGASQS
jgi:hypothetical protein